jgi:protein-export membrane protein SecD
MKKHTIRTILIWASIVLSLIAIYPTVGWMLLSPETREAKLAQWKQEDEARAIEKHGYFANVGFKVKRWAECDRNRVINLGLDLQGGIQMVLSFDYKELSEEKLSALREDLGTSSDEEIETMAQEVVYQQLVNRIEKFEAKEPIIQKMGTNQIQVQLPGEKDTDRAIKLMTQAAVLNFHIVAGQDESFQVFTSIKQRYPDEFASFFQRPAPGEPIWVKPDNLENVKAWVAKLNADPAIVPEDKMLAFGRTPKIGDPQRVELYLLDKKPIATGDGLKSATSMPDPQNPSQWAISFTFDNAGAAVFGKATEENIGRPMAIVLDDLVVSAPTINGRIDFNGQITGRFDADEARDLAIALNSGSMVVKVRVDSTDVVTASLGSDSVRSGVTSALWGLLMTSVFVVAYYMFPGFIALIALLLNGLFILAAMAYFGMTLTLPGIAGLILSIGMAVDSNVLVFERIREELRLGHSVLSAIDTGLP